MNADGELVLEPNYEAIGEFKRFGYAVMQREGQVGLLGPTGEEIVEPAYDDLKVLDSTLFAVMKFSSWRVINLRGELVLEEGYEQVRVLPGGFMAFTRAGKWGIVNYSGQLIAQPAYDGVQPLNDQYFVTKNNSQKGLLTNEGTEILPTCAEEIRIYNDSLFLYKLPAGWGGVDQNGDIVIEPNFETFKRVTDHFVELKRKGSRYLYSLPAHRIISRGEFDGFYPFSADYILCKKSRRLGLLSASGDRWLTTRYDEIQAFTNDQFRVKVNDIWGVVGQHDTLVVPFEYSYIAPLKGQNCLVKRGPLFGLLNRGGDEVVAAEFDRIELKERQAHAYKGEALSLFYLDEEGNLQDESNFKKHFTISIGKKRRFQNRRFQGLVNSNAYTLANFEWFYSSREDKWGLRRLDDGSEQIKPTFDWIQVEADLGFTIVGIEQFGYYSFERTTYRFEMSYGIVNNEVGLLVTGLELWDIRLSDFRNGYPAARVVFSNGRHGLMSLDPVGLILRKDYAYIGEFHNGLARMSAKGRLSGSFKKGTRGLEGLQFYLAGFLSNNYMVDYTIYDQEFEVAAQVVCEDCEWGYLDTLGNITVAPEFSFARNFVNEVGIVEFKEKWGAVDQEGRILIPFKYDGVHFLENTDNQIIRVYNNQQKYGLIDTLGQVTVNLNYDKIGAFNEDRLAVYRNGLWGFVDGRGNEVIPCRFKRVKNFNNGMAVVKLGNKWGAIDPMGEIVIDFQYTRLGNFSEGLAWAYTSKGGCYINTENEVIIPARFDKTNDFEGPVARVMVNGRYGLINRVGDYILRPRYTNISEFDEYGLAVVQFGRSRVRYGLIDRAGNLRTRKSFRKIAPFSEGLAAVKYKDSYGFINLEGRLVISARYSKVADFKEGRAAVQREGVCGYIDAKGNEVIGLEYSKCLDFEDGKAVVYHGYKRGGLIDREGNYIIEPSINRLFRFSDGRGLVRDSAYRFYYITENVGQFDDFYVKASEFQHGVAVVQSTKNGKWGVINQKGIALITPKYDKIERFKDGYARVRIQQFSGLTNLAGQLIVEPDYEYISYAGQGLFRVEKGDQIGYFDAEGNWVWGLSE